MGTIAAEVLEETADAIRTLITDPCGGDRMRGPRFEDYCEYRFTGRTSFRVIYGVDSGQTTLTLVYLGEHTLRANILNWVRMTRPPGRTATKLGMDDVYAAMAKAFRLSRADVLGVLTAIATEPQLPCC